MLIEIGKDIVFDFGANEMGAARDDVELVGFVCLCELLIELDGLGYGYEVVLVSVEEEDWGVDGVESLGN